MGRLTQVLFMVMVWLLCGWFAAATATVDVKVTVEGATSIAKTDDTFVCATLDWWPKDKCDYDQCPWGQSGIPYLDLKNKILVNAIKAFNPLRLRVGGSLQDQVIYKVGDSAKDCKPFTTKNGTLFGFDGGCLDMDRWDQLNSFFNQTGAKVTFGINALIGKKKTDDKDDILWEGEWDPNNARDFINYTRSKGYNIESYEFGNELCGTGVSARIAAKQYAKDVVALKKVVQQLYPDEQTQPKVLGPSGFYDETWFIEFLQGTGFEVLDGVTHHIYNLGAGVDKELINRIQDPLYLDQIAQTFKDVSKYASVYAPWTGPWVSESGGAYNSGGKDVSHYFVDGFWYIDQLGMTSTFNHKVYCRQALIGGNYALLNTTTFIPNPDYYGGLLWHRLMGTNVLKATHEGSPKLRVYSHCARDKPGISLVLINMSNSSIAYDVTVSEDYNLGVNEYVPISSRRNRKVGYSSVDGGRKKREEYHLTPEHGNVQSDVVLLNDTPLKLTDSLDIPPMNPKLVDASSPIHVQADSIVYVTLRDFNAPACA